MATRNKRGGRRKAAEVEEPAEVETTAPAPVTNGLGEAIESVRAALAPFDGATRKKVIKAAEVMLR